MRAYLSPSAGSTAAVFFAALALDSSSRAASSANTPDFRKALGPVLS
eukprot:CAMPEP_0185743574 /NCGR_PEP_ID=MMETSP1174-20130828/1371_1 /TAXON_ID=35687 /ORGANISM="Dictyocha speculum, Strain CCMP1381" /LENGTH=46 /DNA_ID= /DNA_START= /DNA_END= /DNA_ORIENTATION=